jgi:hypothetical protein
MTTTVPWVANALGPAAALWLAATEASARAYALGWQSAAVEAFWAAGSARRYESPNALFGDGAMSDVRRVINIGRGQAPLAAAEVRKDRRECPENILPSKPARVA